MENKDILIRGGLEPTKKKDCGYSFGAIFGYAPPEEIPDKFIVNEPLDIKHQGTTQCCVAYSLCSVSEDQEGVPLDPAFTIKTISEITKNSNWVYKGTSLKVGAESALKGFLANDETPYTLEKNGIETIADPQNWRKTHDAMAENRKKKAFFWIGVSGKIKMFDAIKGAMYRFKDEKRSCQTGLMWYSDFTHQTKINKITGRVLGGHAIKIYGWDDDYLILQNSYGRSIGNNGIQYIHKDVVNKLFKYKATYFQDMPEDMTHEEVLTESQKYRICLMQRILLALKETLLLLSKKITWKKK